MEWKNHLLHHLSTHDTFGFFLPTKHSAQYTQKGKKTCNGRTTKLKETKPKTTIYFFHNFKQQSLCAFIFFHTWLFELTCVSDIQKRKEARRTNIAQDTEL